MITVRCSEIWGGINSENNDVCSRGVSASLYSQPFEGRQGGDIYYFTVCGKDLITRIAIADVVGHGVGASEVSEWLYKALSDQMNKSEGSGVLSEMNEIAFKAGVKGMTTASVFTINKQSSTFSFANSGHPPFLYKKSNESTWNKVGLKTPTPKGNLPLGTLTAVEYDEETFQVNVGDRFFFFTDGWIVSNNFAIRLEHDTNSFSKFNPKIKITVAQKWHSH